MRRILTYATVSVLACLLAFGLAACGGSGEGSSGANENVEASNAALAAYPKADISSYECAEGYDKEYQLVDMTVAQVAEEMDKGTPMVVYCGYNACPWCNAILNHLNDIAIDKGFLIAYIDTRKNPEWSSNTDIDDYDLFVEKFGSALEYDDDIQMEHLYVPHVFFVADGAVVSDHPGTTPSQESPSDPLTEEQITEYNQIIGDGLTAIGF